jgi:hypothetical protein
MKKILSISAITALVAACTTSAPEERVEQNMERAALAQEVSQGMSAAVPAAISECFRMIEVGAFSTTNLTKAGFKTGSPLSGSQFFREVSSPIRIGIMKRPLRVGMNIGPNAGINFRPGCSISLPAQGNGATQFQAFLTQAAIANGYEISGSSFVKGALKISRTSLKRDANAPSILNVRFFASRS